MVASAILYASDLDRMSEFYGRCFDMAVTDRAEEHCVLESDAWSLILVHSRDATPTNSPAPARTETAVKLAFAVSNLQGVRDVALQLGGRFNEDDDVWSFANASRCDCIDPEGNIVQLVQPEGLA